MHVVLFVVVFDGSWKESVREKVDLADLQGGHRGHSKQDFIGGGNPWADDDESSNGSWVEDEDDDQVSGDVSDEEELAHEMARLRRRSTAM